MNLAALIACGVCRLALAEHRDGQHVTFRHPVADDSHEVLPVDAGQVESVFNWCHTCTGAPPVWNYRTGLIGIAAADKMRLAASLTLHHVPLASPVCGVSWLPCHGCPE